MQHIVLELLLEWKFFAFNSMDRQILRSLLRHYGVLGKITKIIRKTYKGMTCRAVYNRFPTDAFQVWKGVRQGYLLSATLFTLAFD